jgi:hypothetical protein
MRKKQRSHHSRHQGDRQVIVKELQQEEREFAHVRACVHIELNKQLKIEQ